MIDIINKLVQEYYEKKWLSEYKIFVDKHLVDTL